MNPDISIIIVSFNTKDITLNCIRSMYALTKGLDFEIIVVDNASSDGSTGAIRKKFPHVKIINNSQNLGFGTANNQGAKIATGKYLLFLNSDTIFIHNTLSVVQNLAAKYTPPFVLGCKLINQDQSLQYSTGQFPDLLRIFAWALFIDDLPGIKSSFPSYHLEHPNFYRHEREVDWVMGAFMFTPRQFFQKTGGFDEQMFLYGEEIEWQMRAKKLGAKVIFNPITEVIHLGRSSSNKVSQALSITGEFKGILYIYKKHFSVLDSWIASILIKVGIYLRILIFSSIKKGVYREALAKI